MCPKFQILYALRIGLLRAHGMDDSDLQTVSWSVVIFKLTYASSARWGFTSAVLLIGKESMRSSDEASVVTKFRQTSRRLLNFVVGYCRYCSTRSSLTEHVLNNLLPPTSVASQNYNLRQRRHHLELPNKTNHLIDNNFIQRMLFLDSY